jgi:hypothetical protein
MAPNLRERMEELAQSLWDEGQAATARRSTTEGVAYRNCANLIRKALGLPEFGATSAQGTGVHPPTGKKE